MIRFLFSTTFLVLFTSNLFGGTGIFKTYGTAANEGFYHIAKTNDGGFIACGLTDSGGSGNYDAFLVKTDIVGKVQWTKAFGGNQDDEASWIEQTNDSGFIFTGYTTTNRNGVDIWLVKLDKKGTVQWEKTFGSEDDDGTTGSVTQLSNGTYLLTSTIFNGNDFDLYALILGPTGRKTDSLQMDIAGDDDDLYEGRITSGGFIFAGDAYDSSGNGIGVLLKTDSKLKMLWKKTIPQKFEHAFFGLTELSNGDYLVTGEIDSMGKGSDFKTLVAKFSSTGSYKWMKMYGRTPVAFGNSITTTQDGGFALLSYDDDDILETIADSSGKIKWEKTWGGNKPELIGNIIQLNDKDFLIGAMTESYGFGGSDGWIIRTNKDGILDTTKVGIAERNSLNSSLKIYPNPANQSFTVSLPDNFELKRGTLSIFNISGKLIRQINRINSNQLVVDTTNFPVGEYLIRVEEDNNSPLIGKLIIDR